VVGSFVGIKGSDWVVVGSGLAGRLDLVVIGDEAVVVVAGDLRIERRFVDGVGGGSSICMFDLLGGMKVVILRCRSLGRLCAGDLSGSSRTWWVLPLVWRIDLVRMPIMCAIHGDKCSRMHMCDECSGHGSLVKRMQI
jgi:hypothetical protein